IKIAKACNKPCIGGMYMLVKQAAKAQEIWTKRAFGEYILEEIEKKANIFMKRKFQNCNIYFVGFMASGKTTAAKALSLKMGLDFVDIDKEIEKKENMTISEIFSQKGQEFFRKLERQLIEEYSKKSDMVISAGGGAVMDEKNKEIMKSSGIVVYIDTPFDICLKRIKEEGNRPVAEKKHADRIKELYEKRSLVYSEVSDIVVDGKKKLKEKVEEILGYIDLE
ncbi:MAG: shikimate kinase, partial [Bacillota bacterium]